MVNLFFQISSKIFCFNRPDRGCSRCISPRHRVMCVHRCLSTEIRFRMWVDVYLIFWFAMVYFRCNTTCHGWCSVRETIAHTLLPFSLSHRMHHVQSTTIHHSPAHITIPGLHWMVSVNSNLFRTGHHVRRSVQKHCLPFVRTIYCLKRLVLLPSHKLFSHDKLWAFMSIETSHAN